MNIEFYMDVISYFFITYCFVFIVDYFFLCRKKKSKRKDFRVTSEGEYLIKKFSLDKNKIDIKKMDFHISLLNGLIISFVTVTIYLIKAHIMIKFGIGFVLLFLLIYSIYEIYGRHIAKEWHK